MRIGRRVAGRPENLSRYRSWRFSVREGTRTSKPVPSAAWRCHTGPHHPIHPSPTT